MTHVQSLDRCYLLDDTLARLARVYSDTKFLRARASALGFTSTGSSSSSRGAPQLTRAARVHEDETDDPYDEKDIEDEEEDEVHDDDVDLDVLPTMLVYRDGELVHNWVRVDWEAGNAGIEELLDQCVCCVSNRVCSNHRFTAITSFRVVQRILGTLDSPVTTRMTLSGVTMKMDSSRQ